MSPRMHRTPLILTVAMGMLLAVSDRSARVAAQSPASPPAPGKEEAGWKALFDGKTLNGWKSSEFYGAGKVQVKDGAIVIDQGKIMSGITYTRGDFPKMDYEVTLEGKKLAGEDFFCTTTFPVGDSFCSLVVGGWSGTVVGLSSLDSMDASMNETRTDRKFKTGRWYRLRIRVSKDRIEAWIDRDKVADVETKDRRIAIRVECNASRPFGVSTYETSGAVRDIRLHLLSEAEKKAIAQMKPEKKDCPLLWAPKA